MEEFNLSCQDMQNIIPDEKLNESDSVTDGPFSSLRNNQKGRTVTKEVDRQKIVYEYTIYEPKKNSGLNVEFSNDAYDMKSFPRGTLILMNVRDFRKELYLTSRNGTDKDAEDLTSLFLDIGFSVERHDNPSLSKMHKIVDNAVKDEKVTNLSCVVTAVLTHGEEHGIIYSTDGEILIKDITRKFRVPSLGGKPKFFLFQACRGRNVMDSLIVKKKPESLERDGPGKEKSKDLAISLPTEADFMYAYSTVPEYFSFRSGHGSWFIQEVCSVFRTHAHEMEVYRMLIRVNNLLSERKSETKDPVTHGKRQIASIVSQLRKDFFLYPAFGNLSR